MEYVPDNVEPISRRRLAFGSLDGSYSERYVAGLPRFYSLVIDMQSSLPTDTLSGLLSLDDDHESTLDSNSPELNDDVTLPYLPLHTQSVVFPSRGAQVKPVTTSTPVETADSSCEGKIKEESESAQNNDFLGEVNVKVETAESMASDTTIPMDISKASSADDSARGSPAKDSMGASGTVAEKKKRRNKHRVSTSLA